MCACLPLLPTPAVIAIITFKFDLCLVTMCRNGCESSNKRGKGGPRGKVGNCHTRNQTPENVAGECYLTTNIDPVYF